MLRRELHDGFGPALAGVALGLRAASNLLPNRPSEGGPLVDRMADEYLALYRELCAA